MKKFIFLTKEGFTETPDNKDIENLQVLGFANGKDAEEALDILKQENKYLKDTNFDDIIVMELKNNKEHYFSLKDKEKIIS